MFAQAARRQNRSAGLTGSHAPFRGVQPARPPQHPAARLRNFQQGLGNQAMQHLLRAGVIQAKLAIYQPGDKYEQEADRVADQVMRMPAPAVGAVGIGPSTIQRKCAACEEEDIRRKPLASTITPVVQRQSEELEDEEEGLLQAKRAEGLTPAISPQVETGINSLRGGGQPLPKSARDFFEPRFGADFSHVRIHTDSRAADSARSVNALAYTVGRDIVFGTGQYAPEISTGQRLLAHELTHVAQQDVSDGEWSGGKVARQPEIEIDLWLSLRREGAQRVYEQFIQNAEQYGLPVRFLRLVQRNYRVSIGSEDQFSPVLNELELSEDTVRSLRNMSPNLPLGESTGILSFYHEATHAYFDLMSSDKSVGIVILEGERYYQDAPLQGGTVADDPARIFQEAAASYVGGRAATWWSAFEWLSMATSGRIPAVEAINHARDGYNRGMRDLTFGYQETGGFLGFGTRQTSTTRPISGFLKGFLDHTILEGKIPDRFDDVPGFQKLISESTGNPSDIRYGPPPGLRRGGPGGRIPEF